MQKATLRKTGKLFIALFTVLVSAIAVQTAAAGEAQQEEGPYLHEGNPKCVTTLNYQGGFKPNFGDTGETPPIGDAVTLSDGQLTVTVEVTATNGDGEATTIDWWSNIGVDAVIIKGGDNGLAYVYDPPAKIGTGLTTPINNGGNRPQISHIEFCYDTKGGDLEIWKTAETSSYIRHDWKIEKTVDRPEIALSKEPTAKATYTVTVKRDEGTEYGWQVWGDITVKNGTDTTAKITSVTDELSDYGAIKVECDAPEFPLELEPGQTLNCSYGPIRVHDGSDRKNTATVTTHADGKVGGGSHSVPVTFADPKPVNDVITVIDDYASPDHEGDDIWWEFKGSDSVTYERTFWCKDSGKHTNTAWIAEIDSINNELETGPQDDLNIANRIDRRYAQATVSVFCDTKKGGQSQIDPPTPQLDTPLSPLATPTSPTTRPTDLSCLGADAVRGSRGDSAWGLIGPKAHKTAFFLSKRSYWKVLRLKNTATNPYFKLAAAYTLAKLHRLNGTASTPAVEQAMNWTRRYLETHRAGYSKFDPSASSDRKQMVKRLHRVMRRHTRVLKRYARAMDATRCTS